MFQKIIKTCLYLLVFLMPLFWLPWSVEAFDFNKGYLLFFLVVIGILAWLARMIFQEKRIRFQRTPLDPFVLAFLVVMALASVLAIDRVSSMLGFYGRFWPSLLGILSLGGFYFLITNNVNVRSIIPEPDAKQHVKSREINAYSLLKVFFLSSFLVVVAAFFSLFGLWAKLAQALPNKLPGVMTLRTFNTVGGSLEALSLFLVCLSVLLVSLLALRDKLPNPKPNAKHPNFGKYLLLFVSLVFLVLIDFTASWLVLFISLLLFLIFSFWKRFFKENVNRLSLSIFLMLIAVVFLFANPVQNLLPQDSALNNLPAEVLLAQRANWNLAAQGLKDRPILGAGPSNFSYVFSKYKPDGFLASPFWQLRFDRAGTHISEFIATTGILGTLSYVALVLMFLLISYFLVASFKLKGMAATLTQDKSVIQQGRKITVLPFLIGFVALLVAQFFYYQNFTLAFTFWLILSLGVVSWGSVRKEKIFSFKEFPEVGLVFSIVFWVVLIGAVFLFFNLGKYYLADVYYRQYLVNPMPNIPKLERAVRLAPARTTYHVVLARSYLQKFAEETAKPEPNVQVVANMVALAVMESKQAVSQSPRRVATHEMAGVVYRDIRGTAQGAQEWAVKSFEKALELEPKNPIVLTELGKLLLVSGETDRAKEAFVKAVAIRPDYVDAQLQLALLEDQEGKVAEAQGRLESLVRLSPFSIEARFQLGRIYYNEKEYAQAEQQFKAAIALFPNHSNSLYSLGLVYEQRGETKEAAEMFEKVLLLNPANQDVQNKLNQLKRGAMPVPEEEEEEEIVEEKEEN